MTKKQKYTVVSLFAGAGGMDIGFDLEGFKTIWANDFDKDACETHKAWSGAEVVCGSIEKVDLDTPLIFKNKNITNGYKNFMD